MGNTRQLQTRMNAEGETAKKIRIAVAACETVVHANRIKLLSAKPGNILLIPKVAPKE
ncbi:hypothetical protein MLD56_18935 [Paenibacillus peoriae]|nr:hypothetical protein [Paenibacillus polymyxa]MBP1310699.1 hypothetical protein [Paenibacillus sp. 1182]MCH6189242.1 hypothetical protein [Paenibacillus polymyxa]UMY53632.1 hypothetical protein MLD56_18935 [Paenibacillus peoriae]